MIVVMAINDSFIYPHYVQWVFGCIWSKDFSWLWCSVCAMTFHWFESVSSEQGWFFVTSIEAYQWWVFCWAYLLLKLWHPTFKHSIKFHSTLAKYKDIHTYRLRFSMLETIDFWIWSTQSLKKKTGQKVVVKQLCSNVFGGTKLYTAGTFFWNRPQVFNPLSSLSKAMWKASYIALAISHIPISPQIICRYFSGLNPKLLTRHYRCKYLHNWAVPITPLPPMSLLGA